MCGTDLRIPIGCDQSPPGVAAVHALGRLGPDRRIIRAGDASGWRAGPGPRAVSIFGLATDPARIRGGYTSPGCGSTPRPGLPPRDGRMDPRRHDASQCQAGIGIGQLGATIRRRPVRLWRR
jgi:hypothetical protein